MNGPPSRGLVGQHRTGGNLLGPEKPKRPRHIAVAPGLLPEMGRVDLELYKVSNCIEHVAEKKTRALQRAKEVTDHGEAATLDARVIDGRPLGLIDAALDLGSFEVGVDFLLDAHELTGALQILHAKPQTAVAHALLLAPRRGHFNGTGLGQKHGGDKPRRSSGNERRGLRLPGHRTKNLGFTANLSPHRYVIPTSAA
jgi:hypothetical protein